MPESLEKSELNFFNLKKKLGRSEKMLVQPDDRKKPDSRRVFAIFHNKVALGGGQSAEKTSPEASHRHRRPQACVCGIYGRP